MYASFYEVIGKTIGTTLGFNKENCFPLCAAICAVLNLYYLGV